MCGASSSTLPSGGDPFPSRQRLSSPCGVRQPSSPEDTPDVGRLESVWRSLDIPWEFDVVVFDVAPEGLASALGAQVPGSNAAGPGYNEFCILLEPCLREKLRRL
jgi:hypothetical protein